MGHDLYSFVFRGQLAEQALDKAGRKRYVTEEAFFSEELAKKLHFDEIDPKYVEQSKTMITVFATITAFLKMLQENLFIPFFSRITRRNGGLRVFRTTSGRGLNPEKQKRQK